MMYVLQFGFVAQMDCYVPAQPQRFPLRCVSGLPLEKSTSASLLTRNIRNRVLARLRSMSELADIVGWRG